MLNAKNYARKPIRLTGGAPGEEVWESMKSLIEIKHYEKIKWYCLPNRICSCLSLLAEHHSSPNIQIIIRNIIQYRQALEMEPMNIQCKTMAKIYNEIYKENHIPGLGVSKVITKKK